MTQKYHCYLLTSKSHPTHTYIGVTNNLTRRIRQHNGEISGGAKHTKKHKDWQFLKTVPRDSKSDALKFETKWKHRYNSKNRYVSVSGLDSRLKRMEELLAEEKATQQLQDK